ncbi:FAD-binding oxidoreductase [Peribacillus psychrosaccharolyticus]|uniref:FAD-binding oxidoreductase n=1 Tax=Peribacillus psychrosaccharolyticus TaxID=1407 RepID=UPI003D279C35
MMISDFKDKLSAIFPIEKFSVEEGSHDLGNRAEVTVRPTKEQEIADLVSFAHSNGKKVIIEGGGTKKGFGGLVEHADICLSLKDYKGIVEHNPGDMTITLKAGTSYLEVQNYLAGFNQMISLDPFANEHTSIGGVIAANDSGPKRLGYGSARDAVIGMRLVYPDGSLIRAGGKVVKNVAGYDMNKLFIGSMGTLAVISEITLKLRPVANYQSLVLISFPAGNLDVIKQFVVTVLDSLMEPITLELLSPTLAAKLTGRREYTAAIQFEDVESSVHYQTTYLENLKPEGGTFTILQQEDANLFWQAFYDLYPGLNAENKTKSAALKVGLKNMEVLELLEVTERLESGQIHLLAHGGLGHGISQVYLYGESDRILSAIQEIRKLTSAKGGYAIVKHLPFSERLKINIWDESPSYFFLLKQIKAKVDPNNILNEKRYVGGI